MKRYLLLTLILLLFMRPGQGQEFANIHQRDPLNPEFVPGEVIIKFKDEIRIDPVLKDGTVKTGIISIDEILKKYDTHGSVKLFPATAGTSSARKMPSITGQSGEAPRMHNIYRFFFNEDTDIASILDDLEGNATVDYAEPNYLVYTVITEPNDALYQSGGQWYLDEVGAPYAWDSITGDTTQIIGIIDTGIDWDHPDLDGNIWINQEEIPGNGYDDDYNGFVDDIRGWDFRNADNNPNDDNGHGTHVAGVVAAETNNYTGMAGIAWQARLMPLKVLSGTGSGNMADLASAVIYAAENGATVINMSLGSYGESQTVKAALLNAYSVLCPVAAAGNDSYKLDPVSPPNNTYAPMYPGCYPFVIGVEASMPGSGLAPFSNIDPSGFKYVLNDQGYNYEVMAPGVNIMSTYLNGSYRALAGTSMATPIVAGAVALLKDYKPGITNEEIFARVVQFSQNGLLKIPNILTATLQPDLLYSGMTLLDTVGDADHDGMADAGEYIDIYFTIKNAGGFADSSWAKISLNYPGDSASIIIVDSLSYIGNLDTASYGGEIPAYTTMTGERDPFRIYIKPNVLNEKEFVLNYEIGARRAFSKYGTFEITVINARELYGVLDSAITLGPGKLWAINRSFKISPSGVINMLPGTHLMINKGFPNYGTINGIGTQDSVIIIDGKYGFYYGHYRFAYTHFRFTSPCIFNLCGPVILDFCLLDFFNGVFDNASGFRINECVFREGNSISWGSNGPVIRSVFDNVNNIGISLDTILNNNFCGFKGGGVGGAKLKTNNFATRKDAFIYHCIGNNVDTIPRRQYWGTTDSLVIDRYIIDFWDDPNLAQVFFYPILEKPTPDAHGFVWKVHVNGLNPQDDLIDPVGCGLVTFDVYFNRPMDISYQPFLSFGVRFPYTQHVVDKNASWSADSTVWSASFDIGLETGDGINSIRVSDAYDTEGFRIGAEKSERFQFIIQASSSLASSFTAIPGIGKVFLEWPFDYTDDLMGYNMYRFEKINDSTTSDTLLINTNLITDSVYIDFQVDPGRLYGYCYKIVGTDHKQSDFSKVAMAIPLLTANGDANGDQFINVLDVTAMISFILEQNPKPFLYEAADLNFDQAVDLRDVVLLLNILQSSNAKSIAPRITNLIPAQLEISENAWDLSSSLNLSAIHFVIEGENLDQLDLQRCFEGYEFVFSRKPNRLVGLLYSYDNRIIEPEKLKLFTYEKSGSTIESIKAIGSGPAGEMITILVSRPLSDHIGAKGVQAMPNPTLSGTNVRIFIPDDGLILVSIASIDGRMIFSSGHIPVKTGWFDYYWPGRDHAFARPETGVYLLQVRFSSESIVDAVYNTRIILLDD